MVIYPKVAGIRVNAHLSQCIYSDKSMFQSSIITKKYCFIHSYIEHLSKCKWFPEEKIVYNHIIKFMMLLSIYQGIKLLHVSITEGEACHSEDTFLPPACPAGTSCLLAMAFSWTIMMSKVSTFSQVFLPLFRTEYNFFFLQG